MALDFSVLQGMDPAGAFFRGQEAVRAEQDRNMLRQAQMEQMDAQRENMLAQREDRRLVAAERQAKMDRAAQRQTFLGGLSAEMAKGGYKLDRPTLGKMLDFGMSSGEDSLIKLATEGLRALDEDEREQSELARLGMGGTPAAAAPATLPGAAPAAPSNLLAGTPYDIGPVNALAAPAPAAAPAGVTREQVQQMLQSPSARVRERGKALAQTLPKESATPSDVAAMQALGFPLTQQGYAQFREAQRQQRLLSPEEEAQRVRIGLASRPSAQPAQPSAPVAVVDDATGKVKFVTREEALGKTPAAAMESLTPKERQLREAKYPQATSAIKAFENTSSTLIKDLETLANHPGLPSITGIAAGRLPGITSQGREAQALYDKIMARGGFQELQNMRQASPTGGALGNVSNAEGQRLQAAFAALDRTQDAPSVRKAIRDAIAQTQAAKQVIREAYDLTYEYRQQGAATPTAAPNIDALLNKYK